MKNKNIYIIVYFLLFHFFIVFHKPIPACAASLDILHYDIQMEVAPDKNEINAQTKISIQNGDKETSEVHLEYVEKYIHSIAKSKTVQFRTESAEIDGNEVKFSQNSSLTDIKVQPEKPIPPARTFTLLLKQTVVFEGIDFSKGEVLRLISPVPSYSMLGGKIADLFTFSLSAKAPEHLTVISPGHLSNVQKEGEYVTKHWESKTTYSSIEVVIGPYKEKKVFFKDIPIIYYYIKDTNIEKALRESKKILEFYTSVLGAYPYEQLSLVEYEAFLGGPSMIYVKGDTSAHEIAHVWWAFYVPFNTPDGLWIVEALATYFSLIYDKAHLHDQLSSFEEFFIPLARENLDLPSTGLLPSMAERYTKGPFIFRMLSYVLGEQKANQFFKTLVAEYHGKNIGIRDLKHVAENISGQELDWFFKEWFESTGCLKYSVKNIKAMESKKGFMTSAEIVQENKLFKMPVEVLLHTKKKDYIQTFWVESQVTEITFETENKPEYITIDPNHFLLIDYGQPVLPVIVGMSWQGKKDFGFIIIYGTAGSKEDTDANLQEAYKIQELFQRPQTVIKSDVEINEDELKNNVLHVIGGPSTNRITKMAAQNLPLQFEGKTIVTKKKKYRDDDMGIFALGCRNPFNPRLALDLHAVIGVKGLKEYPPLNSYPKLLSYYIYKGNKILESGPCEKEEKIERLKFYVHK